MGASAWEYFTPYQPDIKKALHELRQQVFDAGDYYLFIHELPSTEEEYLREAYAIGMYTPDDEEQLRQVYREEKERYSKPKPDTIEELFKMCTESGTHTILDIGHLADDPECNDYFTAIPLSEAQLLDLFGTTKLTRKMIEEKRRTLWSLRQNWQATYIIVYKNGKPEEIYFAGFSGD